MNEKIEEPQERAGDRPPMPYEELQKILEAHRKWVESGEKEGERAVLSEGDLERADLFGATGLIASQVKKAGNWEMAFYSSDFLKKLGLPPDHNEMVKKKLAELEKEKKAAGGQ